SPNRDVSASDTAADAGSTGPPRRRAGLRSIDGSDALGLAATRGHRNNARRHSGRNRQVDGVARDRRTWMEARSACAESTQIAGSYWPARDQSDIATHATRAQVSNSVGVSTARIRG